MHRWRLRARELLDLSNFARQLLPHGTQRTAAEIRLFARRPGAGGEAKARTPLRVDGLTGSLRFSTMNPFFRPTARPVLSIPPGMIAMRSCEATSLFFL
jgi:hypothetical protein